MIELQDVPDGAFNAQDCEITPTGSLIPASDGTFTNQGATKAVLTNNGLMGTTRSTWINEAGATIVNNGFLADGAGWQFLSAAGTGDIDNAGTINNNGDLFGGLMRNTGTISNAGVWQDVDGVEHTNSGDIFNLSTGLVDLTRLENQLGATLDNAGVFELGVPPGAPGVRSTNAGHIVNSGTFLSEMNEGAIATAIFNNTATGTFTNQSGGQATFVGSVENRGAMTNEAGAIMTSDVGNGPFTVLENGQLNNAGTFNNNGVFVVTGPDATVNNTGVFNSTFFALRIHDRATLNNEPGATLHVLGRLELGPNAKSPATVNNAGTINIADGDVISGFLFLTAASVLTNAETGVINVDSSAPAFHIGTIDNAGVVDMSLSVWPISGLFINRAGATLDINELGSVSAGLGATVENAGTVSVSSVGGINFGTFGRYTQTAGRSTIDTLLRASEIDFQGGTLGGNGTIDPTGGPVTNTGATVAPGASTGTLTITGDYMQGKNGTLSAEIGGYLQGDEYDWLDVSGTVDLAGLLEVTMVNGFVPLDGDAFTVLTAAEVNGQFDDFSSNGVPDKFFVNVVYGATAVTVETPELGDCAPDGIIDRFDYKTFQACFTGPDVGPVSGLCECADFDNDGDGDLVDFSAFQRAFDGS